MISITHSYSEIENSGTWYANLLCLCIQNFTIVKDQTIQLVYCREGINMAIIAYLEGERSCSQPG